MSPCSFFSSFDRHPDRRVFEGVTGDRLELRSRAPAFEFMVPESKFVGLLKVEAAA